MNNIQSELNAIAFAMQTKRPELLVSISTEHFGNQELAKVFLLVRRFYLDQGEFPGWDILRSQVARACKKADTAKFLTSILDQAQHRDITGMTDEILLQELKDYHKFRTMLREVERLVQAVEVKDIEAALGLLKELHDKVFIEAEYSLDDGDASSFAVEDNEFRFRRTGIKPIDDRGGLIIGGYTLIAAYAKTGKSVVAAMIALYQYLFEEGSIAYFSYEMGKKEVFARIISNFADIDLGDLLANRLSEADQRRRLAAEAEFFCGLSVELSQFVEQNCHLERKEFLKLLFQNFPKRSNKLYIYDERIDYLNLLVKMKLLAQTKGVKLFICDYPWLVPRGKAFPGMQSWEFQLEVSKGWKTFAHENQCNVLTPAQLDPGKKGEDPRLKFVTNAINDTDLTLYMVRTDEDKILDTTTFTFAAMRNFLTVEGTTEPMPFKMQRELNKARFTHMDF